MGKKGYLNHGESRAVFGNNDTPIGRNDSTCRNVFSLCLNDSRHAALPIGFTRVQRQQACTCMSVYAPKHTHGHIPPPSTQTHTITHLVLDFLSSRGCADLQHPWGFAAASLVSDLLWHCAETAATANVNPAALPSLCLSLSQRTKYLHWKRQWITQKCS